uniref:Uncharacterized protein n=1 Tax=Grammatophora oceanica TaxID=210454 RepID=A0A7S1YJS1_9STRA|eukprot:CAMPEP_0194026502 /NCGR_PEP_ID=MMETSP0009_2-20130614/787_1 /TAXON_ID=210454 /ORGANISM="Grammatophora oceanica, Strain CCMP 410" /LENGTH=265 /DNA_ID=CAMNT_0038665201 /DNA_START=74 /DNA_END=871 /DNA_ORIENTATION=+
MAPNKKTLANVIDTFAKADIGRMVKAEFQPLTTKTTVPSETTTKAAPLSSEDYWAWEADTNAEELKEVLSAQHIEDNLVREATELTETEKVSYWDEAVKTEPASHSTATKDVDYWSWSTESITDVLTADHVQENLVKAAAISQAEEVVRSDVNSDSYWDETTTKDIEARTERAEDIVNRPQPSDGYWSWPASKAQQNELTLTKIQRDEAIRELLSAAHIVANLEKEAADLYWQSEQEQKGIKDDAYWSWSEPQAVVAAPKGYWDW